MDMEGLTFGLLCTRAFIFTVIFYIYKRFNLDVDGGWSGWKDEKDFENDCTKIVRYCDNPSPCNNGAECKGPRLRSDSNCPSGFYSLS